MQRLLFLFTLSVALYSCTPQPMCDDPNAINYEDLYSFCQYQSHVHFYLSESTLELIREYTPNSSTSYSVNIRLRSAQSNQLYDNISIWPGTNFDNYNIQVPVDCNVYYYNSLYEYKWNENPAGTIEDLYVTLEYYNKDPIVLWSGEVHFDPSDPCKIIEITYE